MRLVIGMTAVIAMPAVAAVHKQMQERAQEQERVRQEAEEVRRVFSDEIKRRNAEKGQKNQTCA